MSLRNIYSAICPYLPAARSVVMWMCVLLAFVSCHKDEPDGGSSSGGGSSSQDLIEATVNVTMTLPEISATRTMQLQSGHIHRFIVEIHNSARKVIDRKVVFADIEGFTKAVADFTINVAAGSYRIAVWSDYVRKAQPNNDLLYDTSTLIPVKFNGNYSANSEAKDCFCGTMDVTIAQRSRASTVVSAEMQLQRPMGRVEFVTTDMLKFRSEHLKEIALGEEYKLRITYPQYIASGFNVHDDVMKELVASVSFMTVLDTSVANDRCVIAFDYLFAESAGSEIPAVVELLKDDEVLARSSVKIPVRRGENTIVSGEFLTQKQSGGVSIDTDYDGIITIDLGTI